MSVWDTSTPAGPDPLSQGDDKIREMKTAIQEALRAGAVAGDNLEGVEAVFPGTNPSSAPVYRYRGLKDSTVNRPTAGQYGLFFDDTRNVLQRDNGTSWDDIGTMIPSGTRMVFYQASAPVGWTAVALNDKFLRVVTAGGTGGSTGGTVAASTSLAHTHTVANHDHSLGSHSHTIPNINLETNGVTSGTAQIGQSVGYTDASGAGSSLISYVNTGGSTSVHYLNARTATSTTGNSSGNTGSSSPATDSQLGAFAYADVIVCSKD